MRIAAVLLCALVCSGAFGQSKPNTQVRQAEEEDLIIKEWHSPVTFEIDGVWLGSLPTGHQWNVEDLPSFLCEGVTVQSVAVKKTRPRTGITRLKFDIEFNGERSTHDKSIALEFTLLSGDAKLPLGRSGDFKVKERDTEATWVYFEEPDDRLAPYLKDGANTRIRVSMIVQND